ncbi:MAG: molybdenum cofactor guanylyltransferase [Candidatus Bipolaricaulis sp.]|nr:molybdenum cofactor guanylyltransferase [Candidatus Bipolaricaulis sp.]
MIDRATLVILAGGASRRMGRPKHLLPTPRGTLVEYTVERLSPHFAETLLVGKPPLCCPAGVRAVEDVRPEQTPLVGIYSALLALDTPVGLVVGCDMPFVVPALARALVARSRGFDVVVPKLGGFYEPLLAVYRRSCIPAIEDSLAEGAFKITSIYPSLSVREVGEDVVRAIDPDLASLTNLNIPKQLALLARL